VKRQYKVDDRQADISDTFVLKDDDLLVLLIGKLIRKYEGVSGELKALHTRLGEGCRLSYSLRNSIKM
jgi:hypothetical protein